MRFCGLATALAALGLVGTAAAQTPPRDGMSDTWVATDGLGRVLPVGGDKSVPPTGRKRFVGIFYFLWHGNHAAPPGGVPLDNTKLLAQNPDAPAYGPQSAFHWWGEPEAGYFRADDPWVIRRNVNLLQAAQVDVLLLDVTNAVTYPETVRVLCETLRAMRRDGNQTPQIAFVTHAHPSETVQKLWNEWYSKNAYAELWFRWQGKPLLLGDENAPLASGEMLPPDIRAFFTWRYSWAWDAGQHKWPWIDRYPQHWGWDIDPALPEEMPVAVAGHPTSTIGRSFHMGQQPDANKQGTTTTSEDGLHFAEQWERVLQTDPEFVFVTGWNEWVAQRFVVKPDQKMTFAGKALSPGDTFFVDNWNEEYNRDIEPSKSGGDSLYYQLVANIRKFKGARTVPANRTLTRPLLFSGTFAGEWAAIGPEYRDAIGDTLHRNAAGWGDVRYSDTTGRNDIVRAKVACDKTSVYFYVETRAILTPHTQPSWMQLFLDVDQNAQTGWHGYDFAVNLAPPASKTHTTLSRYAGVGASGAWQWQDAGVLAYRYAGSKLELKIPRRLLGLSSGLVALDFHWADNCRLDLFGLDGFFLHGDSAPERRFNYRWASGG